MSVRFTCSDRVWVTCGPSLLYLRSVDLRSLFHCEDRDNCGVVAPSGKLSGQSVGGWNS